MLIHILICDFGGVFWTPPPYSTRQNSRPYYFLCTPPPRRRQRRTAPLHATVLFHRVAARQAPPKRRFFLLFCFSSAPEMTIFLLTRRSTTLPISARGGTCHRRRVFCTWYLYKNRLYTMIYWEKETICKIRHSAPPVAQMEWSFVFAIVEYLGSPLVSTNCKRGHFVLHWQELKQKDRNQSKNKTRPEQSKGDHPQGQPSGTWWMSDGSVI